MLILPGIARVGDLYDPHGLLDRPSALAAAATCGYVGRVLDVAGATGYSSAQTLAALRALRSDANIRAIYGFSGGGYNVRWIKEQLTTVEKSQIDLMIVLGAPLNPPSRYEGTWQLIYRRDPPEGHMAGPRVLLAELRKQQHIGAMVAPTISRV